MEIRINKEIREYQENIFFGLNLRQLIFSILAITVAVGVYFGLRSTLGTETVSWLCILGAIPFGAMGFVKYNGMTAEKLAMAYIKSEWLMPKRFLYQGGNFYYAALSEWIENRNAGLRLAGTQSYQRTQKLAQKKRGDAWRD